MQFVAAGPNNLQIPVSFNTQLPVSGSTLVSPNLNPELFEEPKENYGTDFGHSRVFGQLDCQMFQISVGLVSTQVFLQASLALLV